MFKGIGNIDNVKKKLRIAKHQHENTQAHLCFTISLTDMHTVCTVVGMAILQWMTH